MKPRLLLALPLIIATASHAAPCEAPEHRQFDFWIGKTWRPGYDFVYVHKP